MIKFLKPGDEIYVIEREVNGSPDLVTTFTFVAQIDNYVICSPDNIAELGVSNITELMTAQVMETRKYKKACMFVFPIKDCFTDSEEANDVFVKEEEFYRNMEEYNNSSPDSDPHTKYKIRIQEERSNGEKTSY